jgi:serine O-acetyltransferase
MTMEQAAHTDGEAQAAIAPSPPLGFWRLVWSDMASLAGMKQRPFPSLGGVADVLTLPGFWCVFLVRLANVCHDRGLRPISRLSYFANVVLFGAEIHPGVDIGPGFAIAHPVAMGISGETRIGRNVRMTGACRIGGGGFEDRGRDGHPVIGDDCWLFDGAKAFGPVVIGPRTIVGQSAVVLRSVPGDAVVTGNPATVARMRTGNGHTDGAPRSTVGAGTGANGA